MWRDWIKNFASSSRFWGEILIRDLSNKKQQCYPVQRDVQSSRRSKWNMRRLFGVLLHTPYLVYSLRPLMSTLKFRSLVEMCELNWQISLTPRTGEIWKLGLSVDIRYPRQWAPHTSTPLKRDLIPEDVSHVGGLSLIISPTRDRMGLAPWSEVQSLYERTKYTRKLSSLWTALWLYGVLRTAQPRGVVLRCVGTIWR